MSRAYGKSKAERTKWEAAWFLPTILTRPTIAIAIAAILLAWSSAKTTPPTDNKDDLIKPSTLN